MIVLHWNFFLFLSGEDPLEKGMANPLQYSYLEDSMDRSLAGYSPQRLTELNANEAT